MDFVLDIEDVKFKKITPKTEKIIYEQHQNIHPFF